MVMWFIVVSPSLLLWFSDLGWVWFVLNTHMDNNIEAGTRTRSLTEFASVMSLAPIQ